jgi:hypothetical protein
VVPGAAGIKAELYKMLLYEEGAMFKPHREYVSTPATWLRARISGGLDITI